MFHVPESARITNAELVLASDASYGNNGAFILESPNPGWQLVTIASDEPLGDTLPWEHVSVRAFRGTQSRLPTWSEMHYVKTVFWDDEDVVMQLHPKRSDYVNVHPHVLHLWRPVGVEIPTPPKGMVG